MSVRTQITESDGVYFITFTCYQWLPLIDKCNAYDLVYDQFNYLKSQGHYISGYVIMPNHVHALIGFKNTGKSINSIVGNLKRFLAYGIVNRLEQAGDTVLLSQLSAGVNATEKKRGKLHEVFEPSFDAKECRGRAFINQKLEYIHNNPCSGTWQLAANPAAYEHSSAGYYIAGEQGIYPVTNVMELEDINLT